MLTPTNKDFLKNNCEQWLFLDPNSIGIAWDYNSSFFSTVQSINWREKVIHIQILFGRESLGFRLDIRIVVDNVFYRYGIGKHKWMIGGTGEKPLIENNEFRLKFNFAIEFQNKPYAFFLTEEKTNDTISSAEVNFKSFQFIESPEGLCFIDPTSINYAPIIQQSKPYSFQTILFEDSNSNFVLKIDADFINEDLVVGFWELGRSAYYETEKELTISKSNLENLFHEYKGSHENKLEIIDWLKSNFKGKDAFKNLISFLDQLNIDYRFNSRHN
ncbi:MAG: hypothetical protein JNL69_12090 [Bacteroidia bacterium]|nr:hypothetical protein [Bacteroidia bacterium]